MIEMKVFDIKPIKEIEAHYPNEWVEIEVTKMADDGYTPLEGRLIAHGKKYTEVSQKALEYIEKFNVKKTYSNYIGEITAESILL